MLIFKVIQAEIVLKCFEIMFALFGVQYNSFLSSSSLLFRIFIDSKIFIFIALFWGLFSYAFPRYISIKLSKYKFQLNFIYNFNSLIFLFLINKSEIQLENKSIKFQLLVIFITSNAFIFSGISTDIVWKMYFYRLFQNN